MAIDCPKCAKAETKVVHLLEMPGDSQSDDITAFMVECPKCSHRGLAVYEESRRGALGEDHWRFHQMSCSGESWDRLAALMGGCPEPREWRCQCEGHKVLAVFDKGGRWIGLDPYVEKHLPERPGLPAPPSPEPEPAATQAKKEKKKPQWWHGMCERYAELMEGCAEWVTIGGNTYDGTALCSTLERGREKVSKLAQAAAEACQEAAGERARVMGKDRWALEVAAARALAESALAFRKVPDMLPLLGYGGLPFAMEEFLDPDGVRAGSTRASALAEEAVAAWSKLPILDLPEAARATAAAFRALADLEGKKARDRFLAAARLWHSLSQ